MTKEELQKEVWSLIDAHSLELEKQDYADLLLDISEDAKIRADAVQEEIRDEQDE